MIGSAVPGRGTSRSTKNFLDLDTPTLEALEAIMIDMYKPAVVDGPIPPEKMPDLVFQAGAYSVLAKVREAIAIKKEHRQ